MNNLNTEINKNLIVDSNYLLTFCVEEAMKNKEINLNISNLKNFSSPTGHPYVPYAPSLSSLLPPSFALQENEFYILQDNGFKIKLEESPSAILK